MSGHRDITTEEAIEWVLDPRNDSGGAYAIHVMAANYDSNGEEGEWDGLTVEDVATWADTSFPGGVYVGAFAEWGPFRLMWEGDYEPPTPRGPTHDEALSLITRYIEATMGYRDRLDIQRALEALAPPVYPEPHPRGHEMGENLCVWCLQYDEDPTEECPEYGGGMLP